MASWPKASARSNPAPSATSSATIAMGPGFGMGVFYHVHEVGQGNSVNPYSLGLTASYTFLGCGLPSCIPGTFSGEAMIDAPVPEPASVTLFGGVLLFAAAGLRRQTRKA